MPKIQVLVGMVASGKSTYALEKARQGWLIVNEDSIVLSVHAGDYSLYDAALKPLYKCLENAIVTTAIAQGRNVVIDRVNGTRSTRARWLSLGKSLDVPVEAVLFPARAPEVHARRRFLADARGYSFEKWLNVVKRHLVSYEPCEQAEGFDALIEASKN